MKVTRRKLAAAAITAAAAQAFAQTPAANADEELKAARDRIKGTSDALARLSVPMDTEPAFQFKA